MLWMLNQRASSHVYLLYINSVVLIAVIPGLYFSREDSTRVFPFSFIKRVIDTFEDITKQFSFRDSRVNVFRVVCFSPDRSFVFERLRVSRSFYETHTHTTLSFKAKPQTSEI